MTVAWDDYPISRRHYFASACGHRHRTANAAAHCRTRGYGRRAPVIEVLIRPGRCTRTREIPEGVQP